MATVQTNKEEPYSASADPSDCPRGPHGGIELLLVQSVEHLGTAGRRGRSPSRICHTTTCIPQGLATVATEHHKRMVEKHRARLAADPTSERVASLKALAKDIWPSRASRSRPTPTTKVTFTVLLGRRKSWPRSKRANFSIANDQIRLEGPLRELGLYTVKVHLGQDVDSEVKVWVVPSVADDEPAK